MQTEINGIKLAYTDEGSGSPLLFVHGFPLCRGAWEKQIEAFKTSHRVIAPDLRGLGESGTTGGMISMAQYGDDLGALLKQLDCGPVVLIGHSMGGYIALPFADECPEWVRGLVLVGTKAGNDTPEGAEKRRQTADKVAVEGIGAVVDAMAPGMLAAGNPDTELAAQVRGLMTPSRPDGVIGALLGMAARGDSTLLLKSLQMPILLVTGADDVIVPPAESEKIAGEIHGATLRTIPGAGHLAPFEKPEAFNAILKEWLVDIQ